MKVIMDKAKMKIVAWKDLADKFFNEGKKVYIKDFNDDFYFANIILVGEETITVECFSPESRKGQKFMLYWAMIQRFDEYKEMI